MDSGSASQRPVTWPAPLCSHGWAAAAASRLRARLARPRTSWEIAGLAIVALLPTLWSGLAVDDFFHRLVVEGKLDTSIGRFDLFAFIAPNPAQRAHFKELGIYPWWIGPNMQVSYWRPVAALTHFVDYSLWPRAAWLMHLENLAWYGALVLACAALYRRFIAVPWVAGLATVCYAFDQAHAYPAAWIANRNALMAAFFGVVSLAAHHRWRTEAHTRARTRAHTRQKVALGAAAWSAFTLALLSAEGGLAIAGYMAAYALVYERGVRQRVLSMTPYVLIVVAWRVVYRHLGYGAVGSGANLDPLVDGGAFVIHAVQTLPVLLASEIVAVPPELLVQHPAWLAVATLASASVLAIFGYAVWPLFRRDRSSLFFALGALLSAVPLGGTFPSDRYLFWAGLGIFGLVAQLTGVVFGDRESPADQTRYAVCCALLLLRGIVSPAVFPFRAAGPGLLEDDYEHMVDTIPRGPDFAKQTVVVLNAPIDLFGICLPIVAIAKDKPSPAHMYMLYAGTADLTVSRKDPRALELQTERGWFARFTDRLFRNVPLALGETVDLAAMSARVGALTADGRPESVVFSFPTDLDDPSLLFLEWGSHGFERVTPPRANASLTVPAAPFFVSDVLRPHIRQRAVEDDQASSTAH
jgi:hypothetical protein